MFLSSLFLVANESKKTEIQPYTGVEGLFLLWKESMSMYRTSRVDNGFNYVSFTEDFINSKLYHDSADAASRNDHAVNLGRIRRLLQYEQLVKRYSSRELNEDNFIRCMVEVMTGTQSTSQNAHLDFQCHFNSNAVKELTLAINAIPLFSTQITEEIAESIFNRCEPQATPKLKAHVNQHVAYFFSMLDTYGLICHNYQNVIAKNHLICSSASDSPLTAHNLAQSLDRINCSVDPIKNKIEGLVKRIKMASLTDDSTLEHTNKG